MYQQGKPLSRKTRSKDRSVADTLQNTLPEIEINIACDGWPELEALDALIARALSSVIGIAGLTFSKRAALSLLFCDDQEISRINFQFRKIDKPTNVLSFPDQQLKPGESGGEFLGDIAIALQTTKSEAKLERKQFDHHLIHLVIHGFLHLFGYDHITDEDAAIMESLEISALHVLDIDNPYRSALEIQRD